MATTALLVIAPLLILTTLALRRINHAGATESQAEQPGDRRAVELDAQIGDLRERTHDNELFVYAVSHDLRSPLVNLEGFSHEISTSCARLRELLQNEALSESARRRLLALVDGDLAESAHFIQAAVGRLSGKINALLRLSRAGRVVYDWQLVEVNAAVTGIVQSFAAQIAERAAVVTVADMPPAWGDPTAIDQIFANLIANALSYTDPTRPARIEIGALPISSSGGRRFGTYFVRDNGLGVPKSQHSKVFGAFQRLHPNAAPGDGMGLLLVKRVVQRHGGQIRFESAVGEGTTFFASLPVEAPQGMSQTCERPLEVGASLGPELHLLQDA